MSDQRRKLVVDVGVVVSTVTRWFFVVVVQSLITLAASASVVRDHAVELSATATQIATSLSPTITLSWPQATFQTTNYVVSRKLLNAPSWGVPVTNMAGSATSFADTNVVPGVAYEYRVVRNAPGRLAMPYSVQGFGYICAGINLPQVESRGKVLLCVDTNMMTALSNEVARLQQDLVGDGWTVLTKVVPRKDWSEAGWSSAVQSVKQAIKAEYFADSNNVKSVFLLGHVPVPYSGNVAPDGHGDHQGTWPADVYYGDMTGVWTDTASNYVGNARLSNMPGDGKFDQSYVPGSCNLAVGRVDMYGMSSFGKTEVELLRRYLDKDHAFRQGLVAVADRGLVDDNFGEFYYETFAASGWKAFAPLIGASNAYSGDWFTDLRTNSIMWAYGCGGGNYKGAGGVGSTSDFVTYGSKATFTMLFGSYFGDWDNGDAFMRAPLAAEGTGLTCTWAGRPHAYFHSMGIGDTVGSALTRSYTTNYYNPGGTYNNTGIWRALMGDPTLRMRSVARPGAVQAAMNGANIDLTWSAAGDAKVLGYHVYRATNTMGPFARQTGSPVVGTGWTDMTARTGDTWYMVRSVKCEMGYSGSYMNLSQGAFALVRASGVANRPPTAQNQSVRTQKDVAAAIRLAGSDQDGDALTYLLTTGPVHGRLTGSSTNVTYTPSTNYIGQDSFCFMMSDGIVESLSATVTVTVTATNDAPVALNQTVSTSQATPKTLHLEATDAYSAIDSYTVLSQPSHGSLSGTAPDLTYTPESLYKGSDSFTFNASDGVLDSNEGTVTIDILGGDGAIFEWRMNEGSGTSTADAMSLKHQGTFLGGCTWTNDSKSGLAVSLDGVDDNIMSPDIRNHLAGGSVTLSLWFKATSAGVLVDEWGDGGSFHYSNIELASNGDVYVRVWGLTGLKIGNVSMGKWHHVALRYDVDAQVLDGFVDGVEGGSDVSGAKQWPSSSVAYAPGRGDTNCVTEGGYFRGKVDNFKVFSRALTASQIAHLAGQPNTVPTASDVSVMTTQAVPIVVTLVAQDVDLDLPDYSIVGGPEHGTVTGNLPAVIYTPAVGYSGPDCFTFKASDGLAESALATVTVFVTALIVDNDDDGLDDNWEVQSFGSIGSPLADPNADPDGDGLKNWQEAIAGTIGTNKASTFVMESEEPAGEKGLVLNWESVTNRYYTVLRCSDFSSGAWSNVAEQGYLFRPGNGGRMAYTNTTGIGTRGLFRIRVDQ